MPPKRTVPAPAVESRPRAKKAPAGKDNTQEIVQLSDRDHVRKRPTTYIGDSEPVPKDTWIYTNERKPILFDYMHMERYSPGIVHLVKEAINNATDNVGRSREAGIDPGVIEVTTTADTFIIKNYGMGIPVETHTTLLADGITTMTAWKSQTLFSQMRSGTNYDDDTRNETAGVNGMGIKAVNFLSKKFIVDHVDSQGRRLTLTWTDGQNLEIKTYKSPARSVPYTMVSFTPDLELFKLTPDPVTGGIPTDIIYAASAVMIGSCAVVGVPCVYNKRTLSWPSFDKFTANCYYGNLTASHLITVSGRGGRGGEYGTYNYETIIIDRHVGGNIGYINAINVPTGSHINSAIRAVAAFISKDLDMPVSDANVARDISVFANGWVSKPRFDSQAKTTYMGPVWAVPELTDQDKARIRKWPVYENVKALGREKRIEVVAKTMATKYSIQDIPKAEDANQMEREDIRPYRTAIFCEGDSAKMYGTKWRPAFVHPVLGLTGEYTHGILPLVGKPKTIYDMTHTEIYDSLEWKPGGKNGVYAQIVRFMGLPAPKRIDDFNDVVDMSNLRYSNILLMADADVDGKHIVSLLFAFFYRCYPQFIREGRLMYYRLPMIRVVNTPITPQARAQIADVPANPKDVSKTLMFTSAYDFAKFDSLEHVSAKNVHYFKGLATSKDKDVKADARLYDHMFVTLTANESSVNTLLEVFDRKKANTRKDWMTERFYNLAEPFPEELQYNAGFLTGFPLNKIVTIDDFINHDHIQYSVADNVRSIPALMDGFKDVQRKFFYSVTVTSRLPPGNAEKVGTLVSAAANTTRYNHGTGNMDDAVMGMTFGYPGAYTMPIVKAVSLNADRSGDKMAASRYVDVTMPAWIDRVFLKEDNEFIAVNMYEEGHKVEYREFYPIIPMCLVNAQEGVGTGWSSKIPSYNPFMLIAWLIGRINGHRVPIAPYYRHFYGEVTAVPNSPTSWYTTGRFLTKVNRGGRTQSVMIHELPIGKKFGEYKKFLDTLVAEKKIGSVEMVNDERGSGDKRIILLKNVPVGTYDTIDALQLQTSISTANMTMLVYNPNTGHMTPHKFTTPDEVLEAFYTIRLGLYEEYRQKKIAKLDATLYEITRKRLFIVLQLEGKVTIINRLDEDIEADYARYGMTSEEVHRYLGLPQRALTHKAVTALDKEHHDTQILLAHFQNSTAEMLWAENLNSLNEYLKKEMPDMLTRPWDTYVNTHTMWPDISIPYHRPEE